MSGIVDGGAATAASSDGLLSREWDPVYGEGATKKILCKDGRVKELVPIEHDFVSAPSVFDEGAEETDSELMQRVPTYSVTDEYDVWHD